MKYTEKDITRFWSKVDIESSDRFYGDTRCWLWISDWVVWNKGGITDKDKYGTFWVSGTKQRLGAHRVSYELAYGEIVDKTMVLHYCDNPRCVNPNHLHLGTQQQNMDEMNSRARRGKICNRNFTPEEVEKIRAEYSRYGKGGKSTLELSEEYGVHRTSISKLLHQHTYKGV